MLSRRQRHGFVGRPQWALAAQRTCVVDIVAVLPPVLENSVNIVLWNRSHHPVGEARQKEADDNQDRPSLTDQPFFSTSLCIYGISLRAAQRWASGAHEPAPTTSLARESR